MSFKLERIRFTVPMKDYVWIAPPGVFCILVSGCGGGSAGFQPSGLLSSGGGGGGSGEMGLRIPMAVTPGNSYHIIVGWGGSKSDRTYDSTGAGIGGPTFITPNGITFAGGRVADNGSNRGGAGGGPNGALYNGNQSNAPGYPDLDNPQGTGSTLFGFAPDSPRHFGGACGSGVAGSKPGPYGGDNIGFNIGGIDGVQTALLRGGFSQFAGGGGAASFFAPGGRGSDGYSSDPYNAVGIGAGGGGAGSASGKSTAEIRSGNGGPGILIIEYPKVQ